LPVGEIADILSLEISEWLISMFLTLMSATTPVLLLMSNKTLTGAVTLLESALGSTRHQ
jgi:hypothetical protein